MHGWGKVSRRIYDSNILDAALVVILINFRNQFEAIYWLLQPKREYVPEQCMEEGQKFFTVFHSFAETVQYEKQRKAYISLLVALCYLTDTQSLYRAREMYL